MKKMVKLNETDRALLQHKLYVAVKKTDGVNKGKLSKAVGGHRQWLFDVLSGKRQIITEEQYQKLLNFINSNERRANDEERTH